MAAKRIQSSLSKQQKGSSPNLVLILVVTFAILVTVALALYLQVISSMNERGAGGTMQQETTGGAAAAAIQVKQQEEPAKVAPALRKGDSTTETLVMTTSIGVIRVVLRPDLSKESVDYIKQIVAQGCKRCNLYRAEKPGILQGVAANQAVPITQVKGSCPPGYETVKVCVCVCRSLEGRVYMAFVSRSFFFFATYVERLS